LGIKFFCYRHYDLQIQGQTINLKRIKITSCFQIEVVDPLGQIIDVEDDVTVERLWDDGAPVNTTTVALKKGLATYTLTPVQAYAALTLNLVVRPELKRSLRESIFRCYETYYLLTLDIKSSR
jgi:hypothetical protein